MNQRSGLIGAIGKAATASTVSERSGVRAIRQREDQLVLVGDGIQSINGAHAFCGYLGRPKTTFLGADLSNSDETRLEAWRSTLLDASSGLDDRLSGHFAVFFCDFQERQVVLVTDRFSSFPVYYRTFSDGLAFSDRADSLFDEQPSISDQSIFDYLYFHCIPGPRTVHEGVHRVEPGCILRWKDGRLTEKSYWGRRPKGEVYADIDTAKQDFRRLLRESVERESENGTTGAFLSGGTDSSTVVGLLAEASDLPVRSFSIGFDVPGYDEASYARLAAKHFGCKHIEYYVTANDLAANICEVASNLEQPFGNSSLLPAMICAERAREEGVSSLLAGDGGDELFGGNTRYAKQKVFALYEAIPSWMRGWFIEPVTQREVVGRLPILKKLKSYVEQASVPMPDRLETYNTLEREKADHMLSHSWVESVDSSNPRCIQRKVWARLAADDLVERMLEYEWKFTLADNDLRKVRSAVGMAGIDVGFPLLDDALVDFSLRLPPSWKVRGLKLRWFFKEALKDFLPPEIIRKKKHGFGLPFGNWALEHTELNQLTVEGIQGLVSRGLLQQQYAKQLLGERLPRFPSYYGELVWVLMMLEFWLRSHSPHWRV